MNRTLVLGFLIVLSISCKSKKGNDGKTPPPAKDAASAVAKTPDAAPTATDAGVDPEVARRAGKRTGLGRADEAPEVATEDLIKAIAAGTFDPGRLIDADLGVVWREVVSGGGADDAKNTDKRERLCGAAAAAAVKKMASWLVDRDKKGQAAGEGEHLLSCSNEYIAGPDADFGAVEEDSGKLKKRPGTPTSYASCESPGGAAHEDESAEVVLVADPKRGLRVAGLGTFGNLLNVDAAMSEFQIDILAAGTPCKRK